MRNLDASINETRGCIAKNSDLEMIAYYTGMLNGLLEAADRIDEITVFNSSTEAAHA